MSPSNRKSDRRTLRITALMIIAYLLWPALEALPETKPDNFVFAQEFLQIFYPDLSGDNRFLSFSFYTAFGSFTPPPTELGFSVTEGIPAPGNFKIHADSTGTQAMPRALLTGLFLINDEGLRQYFGGGNPIVHEDENEKIRALVESHPEWSESQAVEALKKAGARYYDPSNKESFTKSVPIYQLEKLFGPLTIKSIEFESLAPEHVGSFALLDWVVKAEVKKNGKSSIIAMNFEPFEGKLTVLTRIRH